MHRRSRSPAALLSLAAVLLASGCSGGSSGDPTADPTPDPYRAAVSSPRTDTVYPSLGDPGIDALHYDLDLTWDGTTLTGSEKIRFRATATASSVTVDLSDALTVAAVSLDGKPVDQVHAAGDLTVEADVRKGAEHTLEVSYSGPADPVPDPSHRPDGAPLGITRTEDGGLWTMQEPYGASTWYAVNDQPADKAYYDVAVHAPAGMVGISNGELVSRTDGANGTSTRWRVSDPMASYLSTLAIGAYTPTEDVGEDGTPITYWVPSSGLLGTQAVPMLTDLQQTPDLLAWLEERLGPYPFETLSMVIVPSESAMETQSTLTLGYLPEDHAAEVLLHELAHQWYGDLVTPADWADVWMNEGMATYLQAVWQDEAWGLPAGESLSDVALTERRSRRVAGPPGDFKPDHFAEDNVYSGPALMWDQIRDEVGDEVFWRLIRDWPAARATRSVTRADYVDWLSTESGRDLEPLITAWLMSPTTPRH